MLSLPWEIVYMILEHLPPRSYVALALTTKPLFTTLFPTGRVPVLGYHTGHTPSDSSRDLELSERDELLLLLEKDDPTVAFCFDCRKLCAIDSGRGHLSCAEPAIFRWVSISDMADIWPSPLFSRDAAGSPCVVGGQPPLDFVNYHPLAWIPKMQWPAVNFAEARLTVNRHMYGESYGLPPGCLEYRYEFERFINLSTGSIDSHFPLDKHPQGHQYLTRDRQRTVRNSRTINSDVFTHAWTFTHVSEARIIDSELYIARFHSIRGPLVERSEFFNLHNSLDLPICKHENASFSTTQPSSWRPCRSCFTDYLVSVWKNDLTGWNCEVRTCHRLGSCRTPSDPIWRLANDVRTPGWILHKSPDEEQRRRQEDQIRWYGIEDEAAAQKSWKPDRAGGIEACWAHLWDRQRHWKRWEVREHV